MKLMWIAVVLLMVVFAAGCNDRSEAPISTSPPTTAAGVPGPLPPAPPGMVLPVAPISWEDESAPERKEWSRYTASIIRNDLLSQLDKVSDTTKFCPAYKSMLPEEKATVWTQVLASIAADKSNWNPEASSAGGGTDSITGQPAKEEGLLKLTYEQTSMYPECPIKWTPESSRIMHNPYANLNCGARILASQISEKGVLFTSASPFGASLKEDSSAAKEIMEKTKAMEFCRPEVDER